MDELEALQPVSLEALDARAELLQRVDTKYLVARAELAALLRDLSGDHDVLEVDGRRRFAYRSAYFDTPDLRAFHDHVRGVRPRFKLRTRSYLDSGLCVFEVKLKTADDDTDKRQVPHPPGAPERLTDEACSLVREALTEAGRAVVEDMRPLLATEFDRAPVAYLLSAVAAGVYLLATVALARGARRLAFATVLFELVGVLVVGTLTVVDADLFPDQTVWSGYGSGGCASSMEPARRQNG